MKLTRIVAFWIENSKMGPIFWFVWMGSVFLLSVSNSDPRFWARRLFQFVLKQGSYFVAPTQILLQAPLAQKSVSHGLVGGVLEGYGA